MTDSKSGSSKLIKIYRTIGSDFWQLEWSTLGFAKKAFYSLLRIFYLVIRSFDANQCALHASALTYITLMSLVPLLALMFSVAKGLGAQKILETIILEKFTQMPQAIQQFMEKILDYVEKTNFKTIGAIGLLLLLWTGIKVLGEIEKTFNHIWGIQRARTFFRKFADFISILLVVPILLLCAASITATFSSPTLIGLLEQKAGFLAEAYKQLLHWTSTVTVWGAFCFMFAFVPNTRVKLRAALTGGICAGTLWLITQAAYIHFQVGITRYNAIYGTFAAIPIFLAWLYINWIIVLLGAEISFACQNYRTYQDEAHFALIKPSTRERIGLWTMLSIAKSFEGGESWHPWDFASAHRIPIRLVRDLLESFLDAKIVHHLSIEKGGYALARPPEKISAFEIIEAIRGKDEAFQNKQDDEAQTADAVLKSGEKAHQDILARQTLKDLLL